MQSLKDLRKLVQENQKLLTQRSELLRTIEEVNSSLESYEVKKLDAIQRLFTEAYDALGRKNNTYQQTSTPNESLSDESVQSDKKIFDDYQQVQSLLQNDRLKHLVSPEQVKSLEEQYQGALNREEARKSVKGTLEERLNVPILVEKIDGTVSVYVPVRFSDLYKEDLMNNLSGHALDKVLVLCEESKGDFDEKKQFEQFGDFAKIDVVTYDEPANTARLIELLKKHSPERFQELNIALNVMELDNLVDAAVAGSGKYITFKATNGGLKRKYIMPNLKDNAQYLPKRGESFTIQYDGKEAELVVKDAGYILVPAAHKGLLSHFRKSKELMFEVVEDKKVLRLVGPANRTEQDLERKVKEGQASDERTVLSADGKEMTIYMPKSSYKNHRFPIGKREFWVNGDQAVVAYAGKNYVFTSPASKKTVVAIHCYNLFDAVRKGGLKPGGRYTLIKTGNRDHNARAIYNLRLEKNGNLESSVAGAVHRETASENGNGFHPPVDMEIKPGDIYTVERAPSIIGRKSARIDPRHQLCDCNSPGTCTSGKLMHNNPEYSPEKTKFVPNVGMTGPAKYIVTGRAIRSYLQKNNLNLPHLKFVGFENA